MKVTYLPKVSALKVGDSLEAWQPNFTMLPYLAFILSCAFGICARSTEVSSLDKRNLPADPRRNITCLGSSYDLQLPIRRDGINPNELTMQQLCAKTEYGGAPAGQHLGGWCSKALRMASKDADQPDPVFVDGEGPSYALEPTNPQGVSFEEDSLNAAYGWDVRFLLGCFNRCFCNYGVQDLTIQPKRDEPSDADTYLFPSYASGELMIDVDDDIFTESTEGRNHDGRLGDTEVETVELTPMIESDSDGGFAIAIDNSDPPWRLNMDAGNYITCEGDLPSFPLPYPYHLSDFENPQQLCAVQFSGGLSWVHLSKFAALLPLTLMINILTYLIHI